MGNKTLKQLRSELLAKPGVRKAYEQQAPDFAIARALIAAQASVEPKVGKVLERKTLYLAMSTDR